MIVKRASEFESAHSLSIATGFADLNCRFVCIPVLDDEGHARMNSLAGARLDVVMAGLNLNSDYLSVDDDFKYTGKA